MKYQKRAIKEPDMVDIANACETVHGECDACYLADVCPDSGPFTEDPEKEDAPR